SATSNLRQIAQLVRVPGLLLPTVKSSQRNTTRAYQLAQLHVDQDIMLGPSHRRRDELIVAPPRIDSFPGRHRKAWMDADFQRTICRHASDHRVKCLLGYGSGIDHSEEIVVGGKRWPHLRASPAQQGPFSWVEPLQQRGQIRSQGEDRKRLTAVTQP